MSDKYSGRQHVVNDDGEILKTYENGMKVEEEKTKEEKQMDYRQMKKREMTESILSANYINTPPRVDIQLSKELKKAEYVFFKTIILYLKFNSGVLVHNGKSVTTDFLYENLVDEDGNKLYSSKQSISNLIHSLRQHELIKPYVNKDDGHCYVVNPWVAYYGNKEINDTLYDMFSETKWKDISRRK